MEEREVGSFQKKYSYLLFQKSPEHGQWDIEEQYPGQCLNIHNELLLQHKGKEEQANVVGMVFMLGVEVAQNSKRGDSMPQEGIGLDIGRDVTEIFIQYF